MIEIFDEREVDSDLVKEQDPEALALIQELELKTDSGARISYPRPNAEQWFVIQALFSDRTLIKDYDAGCIPLRVLKEIRSYKTEHPTHILIIAHLAKAAIKDPILLAYIGSHSWYATHQGAEATDFRLVARWGEALEPWDELANKAAVIVRRKLDHAIGIAIARLGTLRAALPTMAIDTVRTPALTDMPEGL